MMTNVNVIVSVGFFQKESHNDNIVNLFDLIDIY